MNKTWKVPALPGDCILNSYDYACSQDDSNKYVNKYYQESKSEEKV